MFGERSDIEDMIITLGTPETCLAEVHEEFQLMVQVRKLVASDTSRELVVCVTSMILAGISAIAAATGTKACLDGGTKCQYETTCNFCCTIMSCPWYQVGVCNCT
jgi:hypothetical protein